ncbi:MAG: glycosyltransferase family 39 protein [Gaiellaceae bacterium]
MTESRFRRAALLLAVVGALHGLVYVPLVTFNVATDSGTYVASAEALLDGSYSTPLRAGFYYVYPLGFFDITGLQLRQTTWDAPERQVFRPPGYPLVLAAVGGGGAGASRTLALIAQGLLFGAGVWLLALTVRRWWGPGLGLLAAALYAVDPYSKHYVTLILSEVTAGFVALAAAYAFTRAWQTRSVGWWGLTAALAASLTLVRAVFVVAVPLVVLAALIQQGRVRRAGAVLACSAALLGPWLAWTTSVVGTPVLASYGEGFNLLVAAHGEGQGRSFAEVIEDPAFLRDFRAPHRLVPAPERMIADPEAHPRYVERADGEQRERAWSLLGERLREEPHQLAWEALYRAFFLWNAHEDWYQPGGAALFLLSIADWLVLGLALAGAWLALRRGGPARGIAVFLLVYTATVATHHVEARFAMPVRGLFLALVALTLADVWARRQQRRA